MHDGQLSTLIVEWLRSSPQLNRTAASTLTEDSDLIGSRLLDSLGFIELLVYVESVTGEKIDLSDLDPNEFTTIRGLVKGVLGQKKKATSEVAETR